MKILAIIPARGGSKGIPRKNVIQFLGKPLIQWTIDAATDSKIITDVLVTSDDDKILELSKKTPNVKTIKRPKELAQDNSRTEPVLMHALESIQNIKYDYLVLLQPTSPLRNAKNIDEAFLKLKETNSNSLISVCSMEHHPFKSFKVNKRGFLEGIIDNDYPFRSRQTLPKTVRANGAIYIIKVEDFIKTKSLLTNETTYFEMSKEISLDIDTIEDINNFKKLKSNK